MVLSEIISLIEYLNFLRKSHKCDSCIKQHVHLYSREYTYDMMWFGNIQFTKMAKPKDRYTLKQVVQMINNDEHYTLVNDDSDEGLEANESDESSPPTSQEEREKSPDSSERSSPNLMTIPNH